MERKKDFGRREDLLAPTKAKEAPGNPSERIEDEADEIDKWTAARRGKGG